MIQAKPEASDVAEPAPTGGLTGAERIAALPPLAVALGYLLAISLAELLTTFTEPRAGLMLHSMILALLVLHAALTWDRPIHAVLIALTFAPLIRLVSLSLPLFPFPLFTWYAIISLPLFVTAALTSRLLGLRWDGLGISLRGLGWQIPISLTGLALGYLEYRILRPQSLVASFTWGAIWLPALILLVSTGLFEELVFRGLMQTTALRVLGRAGLPFIALVFAALHIGYKSVSDIVFVFAVGLFFGWVVLRTKSIVGVTLAHGLTNIVLFLVMPFVGVNASPPADLLPAPIVSPAAATPQPAVTLTLTAPAAATATERGTPTAAPTSELAATASPTKAPTAVPTAAPTAVPMAATPGPAPTPAPQVTPVAAAKGELVNVRTRPDLAAPVLGLAQPGRAYTLVGRSAAGDWLLIEYRAGATAWVSAERFIVSGDLRSLPVAAESPTP